MLCLIFWFLSPPFDASWVGLYSLREPAGKAYGGEGNSHGDLQNIILIFFASKKLINYKKLAFFELFHICKKAVLIAISKRDRDSELDCVPTRYGCMGAVHFCPDRRR